MSESARRGWVSPAATRAALIRAPRSAGSSAVSACASSGAMPAILPFVGSFCGKSLYLGTPEGGVRWLPVLDSSLWEHPQTDKREQQMKRKPVRLAVVAMVAVLSVAGLSQ